jgi:hypothetical protein
MNKKKILLIGLNYHDYTRQIVAELRAQGHEVTYHDIQPGHLRLKLLRKFAPDRYGPQLDRYHAGIVQAERGKDYDLVLFIQVHQMSLQNLSALRREFGGARFVLYNWDALSNHDYRPYLHLFDRVFTFDPADARAHGLDYLPLFCVPTFLGLRQRAPDARSIYFVGNIVNPRRYEAVQAFKRYCRAENIRFRYFLSATTHGYTQLLRAGFLPWDVSLRSIATRRFIELIETSAAVFDFANHRQAGCTMRTMENLCAGKKIITSHAGIRHEAFYSPDRFHVFEDLDFSGVKAFLDVPLADPQATFPQFHLGSFVRRLLEERAAVPASALVD